MVLPLAAPALAGAVTGAGVGAWWKRLGGMLQGPSRQRGRRRKKRGLMAAMAEQTRLADPVRKQLLEIIQAGGRGFMPEELERARGAVSSRFGEILGQVEQGIGSAASARGALGAGTTTQDIGRAQIQVGQAEQQALSALDIEQAQMRQESLFGALGLEAQIGLFGQQEMLRLLEAKRQQRQQARAGVGQAVGGALGSIMQLIGTVA